MAEITFSRFCDVCEDEIFVTYDSDKTTENKAWSWDNNTTFIHIDDTCYNNMCSRCYEEISWCDWCNECLWLDTSYWCETFETTTCCTNHHMEMHNENIDHIYDYKDRGYQIECHYCIDMLDGVNNEYFEFTFDKTKNKLNIGAPHVNA